MLTRKASGRRIQNRIRQHNCRHNCPPVLPMNLGNIWLLYDAHTPSFHPRGSAHWNDPPWSSGVHPLPRDAVFDTHKYQHKGKLYPLYTRGWLAGGLWRMETYLPYCCTTLEVGARHECHCQMRHWAMVFKDVTNHSRHRKILYTTTTSASAANITHRLDTHTGPPSEPNNTHRTTGPSLHGTQRRHCHRKGGEVWVNVITEYRSRQQRE